MQEVNVLVFSLTFAALVLLIANKVSRLLATLIMMVYLSSPWITLLAKNVYWVPFSWLLPSLVVLWLFVDGVAKGWARRLAIPLLYGAFALKFLAGFEYATSIILFASTIPLLPTFSKEYLTRSEIFRLLRKSIVIFAIGVIAFLSSLIALANLRGNSVVNGLTVIYNEDIKRRTFGNSLDFPESYKSSLDSNVLEVVGVYVVGWSTNVLNFVYPNLLTIQLGKISLWVLIFLSLLASVLRMIKTREDWLRRFFSSGLLQNLLVLAIPISWFVLAKAHSYVHPHLNFVLWYLLTLPVLFWTLVVNTRFLFQKFRSRL